jgi:hypothetical protein
VAFKNFVKRFYGRQVRYIVSCRDIYWRFFEDEWWNEHCQEIAKDELYRFSSNEFRKALPRYLESFNIDVSIKHNAKKHLAHPLLLRFFCEAYKGKKDKKSELGVVNDVHLLPLFDTYCNNKYEQIRKRLKLFSSSEISELVSMLGLMMLKKHNRSLPISDIRKRIEQQFGESNIYSASSKYVQILDEDIIIEQIPSRSLHQLNVEFVYDEFMEYVIATSMYYSSYAVDNQPTLKSIFALVDELLAQETQFVSVSGVVIFIGGIVAEKSKNDGLEYANYLLKKSRVDLACRVLNRWPENNIGEEVAKILISIHSEEYSSDIRKFVWQTLEDIHWRYWGMY